MLYQDYLPVDSHPLMSACHVQGAIAVQAAPTLAENAFFLLELAREYPFILGVVGWVDLLAANAAEVLQQLAMDVHFCGVRPMLQDLPDPNWILQPGVMPALTQLEALQLTFDALIYPQHLPMILQIAQRHPALKIMIDHAAKPKISQGEFASWAASLAEIAEYPNVFCKLSGLLTEAGEMTSPEKILPYVQHIIQCFGTGRVLWGSDYPVLKLAGTYSTWHEMCLSWVSPYGKDAVKNIFGRNAAQFYLTKNTVFPD